MIKNEDELRVAGCTTEEITRIKKQFAGGVSGARGGQYEDVYATWRLLEAMRVYLDTGLEASVQRQALLPVDDVIYLDEHREEYCQLKTGSGVTWTAEDGKLQEQFELQQKVNENAPYPKPFVLLLITPSEERRQLLQDKLPTSLQTTTEVMAFKDVGISAQLWTEGGTCYEVIRELCAVDSERDSPSLLEAIFFAVYDVIQKTPTASPTSISDVIEEVTSRRPMTALRIRDFQVPERWNQAISILSKIPNLSVDINGGFCHYRYEYGFYEEGAIGRTGTGQLDRFLERVIEHEPDNFVDFEILL